MLRSQSISEVLKIVIVPEKKKKMTNSASKIAFSLNLRKSALSELDFLRQINKETFIDDPDLLQIAVYRYEHLWLPFLLKVQFN